MANNPFFVTPDLFKNKQSESPLLIVPVFESNIGSVLETFLGTVVDDSVGIAAAYEKCALACIALASPSRVLLVRLSKPGGKKGKGKSRPHVATSSPGRELLANEILTAPKLRKLGLNIDRLVTSLFLDLDLRMADGVDLIALAPPKKTMHGPFDDVVTAFGGWSALGERPRVLSVLGYERFDAADMTPLALRAWGCLKRGTEDKVVKVLAQAPLYNTASFREDVSNPNPFMREGHA
jgi:hypothetical protein